MSTVVVRSAVLAAVLHLVAVFPLPAGDMYWSPVPGLSGVNDLAVCGTTVYAATDTGLFRSQGDPESWQQLRPAATPLVACAGSRVMWEESVGLSSVVYVSHDALQTVTAAAGLDDAISRGIRDLTISGSTALVATLWGVERSTDGGLHFPAAYPVLWESSAGYQITAVWTDGTRCAAAGSGGFAGSGIWHSATGDQDTWSQVLSAGGQRWLNGGADGTIVSGTLWTAASDTGWISSDAGASWSPLPLSWGAVGGHYQRPFLSDGRILSRHVWEEFDPGSGQFIIHTNGPLLYDTVSGIGNDMDAGLASEEEILVQAIVEAPDPYLLVAERDGLVFWFRSPGGWPVGGVDFTPPYSPSLNASPRIAGWPATTVANVAPSAGGASEMFLVEYHFALDITHDPNGFTTTLGTTVGDATGWIPYTTGLPWDLRPGAGLHSFYAWYVDAAGNMTDPAVTAGTALFPATLTLAEGGAWGTYMHVRAGESFSIGGTGAGGDIDVHHWEPGSTWSDDWAATWSNDVLAFTARETGFHLVILYNWPGSGTFDGPVTAQPGLLDGTEQAVNDKPAEGLAADPPDAAPPYYTSPGATLLFADGFDSGDTGAWSGAVP